MFLVPVRYCWNELALDEGGVLVVLNSFYFFQNYLFLFFFFVFLQTSTFTQTTSNVFVVIRNALSCFLSKKKLQFELLVWSPRYTTIRLFELLRWHFMMEKTSRKLLTIMKFLKCCLNLKNSVLVNYLEKYDSRKLVLWKSFEIFKKSVILTRLLLFIFGITKPLFFIFFNYYILIYQSFTKLMLAKNSNIVDGQTNAS